MKRAEVKNCTVFRLLSSSESSAGLPTLLYLRPHPPAILNYVCTLVLLLFTFTTTNQPCSACCLTSYLPLPNPSPFHINTTLQLKNLKIDFFHIWHYFSMSLFFPCVHCLTCKRLYSACYKIITFLRVLSSVSSPPPHPQPLHNLLSLKSCSLT